MIGSSQSLVYLFSLASLFCLGLNFTAEDVKLLLRDKRALGRALLANAVLLPFLMWMLLTTVSVTLTYVPQNLGPYVTLAGGQPYVLLLLALASGNLLAPALATVALARVPYTYGMSVIMTLVSVVVVPLGLFVLPLNTGESQQPLAQKTIGMVLLFLVGFQLVPFLVGMAVRARYAAIAAAVRPFMSTLANIVFLLIIVSLLAQNLLPTNTVKTVREGTAANLGGLSDYVPILVGGLILAGAALLIGYFMAGADKGMARGLGIATGLRNVTAVLVVVYSGKLSAQVGSDSDRAATLVLVAYLVELVLVTIVAGEWGRKPIVAAAGITQQFTSIEPPGASAVSQPSS